MPSFNYRTIVMWVLLGRAWVTTSSGSPLFTLLLSPHPELCVQAAGNAGGLGPRQGHLQAKELVKPRVEGGLGSEWGRDLFLQSPANLIWSHSSILSFEGTLFSGALFQLPPGNQSLLGVSYATGSCLWPPRWEVDWFVSGLIFPHQDRCHPFSFCNPPCLHGRGGRGRKRDASESVFLYGNSSY